MTTETDTYLLRRTSANKSFSKTIPGLQIAWDSTSMRALKTCPYKYYLSIIEAYQRKSMADPLIFGIAFHSAMEIYTKVLDRVGHDEAVGVALIIALDEYGHQPHVEQITVEEDCEGSDGQVFCAGDMIEVVHEWKPHHPDQETNKDWKLRTRVALARAVIWYLDHYKDHPLSPLKLPSGKMAAELSFRFELGMASPSDEQYLLCGHLDKVVEFNGVPWVDDYKTTKAQLNQKFFTKFSPDPQMSQYDFAGSVVLDKQIGGVIVDGIQLLTHSCRFGRGFAPRTVGQRSEWVDDMKTWIKQAEFYAKEQSWPMNDTSCGDYGGCTFRNVCAQDPSVRAVFLKNDYIRKIWDPLQTR